MSNQIEYKITHDNDYLLVLHSSFAYSELNMKTKLAKLDSELAEQLTQGITTLHSKRQHYLELINEIDERIGKLEDALGEAVPKSPLKTSVNGQVNGGEFKDTVDKLNAVLTTVREIKDERFGRNEVFTAIQRKHPNVFRNTARDKRLFSNLFWRVIRAELAINKIVEVEKGGGRKQTMFAKINH